MDDKNYFLCKAKVYEQTERWDDMAESMVKVAEFKHGLTTEERDLFSVAFKNSIGPKRSALKIISGIGDKTDTPEKLDIIQELKDKVAQEVRDICNNVQNEIDTNIIPVDVTLSIPLLRKGDYYQYLVEVTTDDISKKQAMEKCQKQYQVAFDIALDNLSPIHPLRLALALNVSLFYYEILNLPERACGLAETAFNAAIAEVDDKREDYCKDSTAIMQQLRDNLTLWDDTSAANSSMCGGGGMKGG
uniref:14-3-3 domain-containing protein n=1 Tax=Cynoglossus semilaevis TaxID=244447 RepID=A0A3P8WG81_CYNSE